MKEKILEMKGIRKEFNGIEVLHSIDFSARKGKVTALVGENGAGKSTLMKILMGEYIPDDGTILLDGDEVRFSDPHDALVKGISMIFQEMSPFPNMTVAQNLFVGREPKTGILINNRKLKSEAGQLLNRLHIQLDLDRKVEDLTVSEMQLLEIAKAVSHNAKVVIMDEPTSALTDTEVKLLFDIIRRLKQDDVSVIYITHKLDELPAIADEICVLRDGSIIDTHAIGDCSQDTIVSEMVGRRIDHIYPKIEKKIGDVIFQVKNYSSKGYFKDISFDLREGEILGLAGMVGAGRTEVVSSIFGILPHETGELFCKGKSVQIRRPADAIRNRMALIPEDRARDGLNLIASVRSNMCMVVREKAASGILASPSKETKLADHMVKDLAIKVNTLDQPANSLSGGNQQKIVLGKWLLTDPEIIFLDEPTRGIDVGAKFQIYQLIGELAKQGKGVVMISSEMPELLGVCDRILVLKEGRAIGELLRGEATQEIIMEMIVNN